MREEPLLVRELSTSEKRLMRRDPQKAGAKAIHVKVPEDGANGPEEEGVDDEHEEAEA